MLYLWEVFLLNLVCIFYKFYKKWLNRRNGQFQSSKCVNHFWKLLPLATNLMQPTVRALAWTPSSWISVNQGSVHMTLMRKTVSWLAASPSAWRQKWRGRCATVRCVEGWHGGGPVVGKVFHWRSEPSLASCSDHLSTSICEWRAPKMIPKRRHGKQERRREDESVNLFCLSHICYVALCKPRTF